MKTALVIRHIAFENLGSLAEALVQKNYTITYLEAGVDHLGEIDPWKPDILVILGGPISANDEDEYPFLRDEVNLLQSRLAADRPTLGICLGAQLMARSLGAKVYPSGDQEVGWSPLELTPAGKLSPLIHLGKLDTSVLHWHGDTFELPTGTTHLALTSKCQNQAFSWGDHCLALQFHPEVTEFNLESWFIGHAHEIATNADLSVTALREATAHYAPKLLPQAALFWQEWLDLVQEKTHPLEI